MRSEDFFLFCPPSFSGLLYVSRYMSMFLIALLSFFCITANGWRYAAYRINITNFYAYKYINLVSVMSLFTTNCGMQYERMLAAGFSHFCVPYAVAKTYLLTSFGRAVGFFSDLAMCMALAQALIFTLIG